MAATASVIGTAPAVAATFVYVSNAGDGDIGVYRMLHSGELQPSARIKAASTVGPMAVSPDRRFLYAALRSEPFTAASFAIDPASGRLRHLGNAPLDDSMAYITVDKTGRWLLSASYPGGKLTVNPIGGEGRVQAPPNQILRDRPKAGPSFAGTTRKPIRSEEKSVLPKVPT